MIKSETEKEKKIKKKKKLKEDEDFEPVADKINSKCFLYVL